MTFGELKTRLARYLGLQALSDDPNAASWGPDALNQAQLEIARELSFPRKIASITTGSSNPITFATDAQSGGLLVVYNKDAKEIIPFFDKTQGMAEYANLLDKRGYPRVALYDPALPNELEIYPLPVVATNIDVYYAALPPDMVNDTDVPWSGNFPEHHDVIALRAAMLILESDFADTTRIGWIRNRYNVELSRLMATIESAPVKYPSIFRWGY